MKHCCGIRMLREGIESSRAHEIMFPSLECRYIIEEEKPNDPPLFDWLSFYHREMTEEVEEAIQTLEKELLHSV